MRRLLILFVLLCCAAAVALGVDAKRFFDTPLVSPAAAIVSIDPGMSFAAITDRLQQEDIIGKPRYALYFALYARATGAATRIKSGRYRLPAQFTPQQLLALLTSGKTVQYRITLIDGWTFAQMRQAVANDPELKHTLKGKDAAAIMAALGHDQQKAEGRFMPDTYFFPAGATDLSIYKRAYQAMQTFVDQAWDQRADDIAVDSPYQALILASIIQKETAVPAERERIAGVFSRRLEKGMRLQTDPSVIYGIKEFDGNITRQDLRTQTPYNTYMNAGLPPTPIALPGRAAIVAALHPAPGKALYFVSKGDGTHKFSATLAAHNRAVRKYQLR